MIKDLIERLKNKAKSIEEKKTTDVLASQKENMMLGLRLMLLVLL